MIALTLSGGGARAIAFHLGCLRALHDREVLKKVAVISSVSGGSVIAGMYVYWNDSFDDFDKRVVHLLRRGMHKAIARHLFSPRLFPRVVATNLISRPVNSIAKLFKCQPPFRRWASRTDALEAALRDIFHDLRLNEVARQNIDIVINACELRTGTAFRFGNHCSGTWRFGEIHGNQITVAHAVACSAAYPMFLPAFDREYTFVKNGKSQRERVIITDGGVYDNLGISCVESDRDSRFSLHSYSPEYIICCSAGFGQLSGQDIPFGFYSRANAAFESIFRKVQDASFSRLHMLNREGKIKGFILPYLGQQDQALPEPPKDLVKREEVLGYPTNFAAMSEEDIVRISRRGEQLTHNLLGHYCPDI